MKPAVWLLHAVRASACSACFWSVRLAPAAARLPEPPYYIPSPEKITISNQSQTPRGAASANLVVVTHGYQDDAERGGWVRGLAGEIANQVLDGWDVWTFDWKVDAAKPWIDLLKRPTAPQMAGGQGQYLARQIRRGNGAGTPYAHVHLIAHSLGGRVRSEERRVG